jgi:hypothetical protein
MSRASSTAHRIGPTIGPLQKSLCGSVFQIPCAATPLAPNKATRTGRFPGSRIMAFARLPGLLPSDCGSGPPAQMLTAYSCRDSYGLRISPAHIPDKVLSDTDAHSNKAGIIPSPGDVQPAEHWKLPARGFFRQLARCSLGFCCNLGLWFCRGLGLRLGLALRLGLGLRLGLRRYLF